MACIHKFEKELDVTHLDYEPETLIVGTFNPAWPIENKAEWFYGRTHDDYGNINNNFWDVLPRVYGEQSLINGKIQDWKMFCKNKKIAITDLITEIPEADELNPVHKKLLQGYSDSNIAKKFINHHLTDIIKILEDHPSIKNIYLTRGIGEKFWKQLWQPIANHAKSNQLHERQLLTPSGYAFYQQAVHNRKNPGCRYDLLKDYILMRWKEKWHLLE